MSPHHPSENCQFLSNVAFSLSKKPIHDERVSFVTSRVCALCARVSCKLLVFSHNRIVHAMVCHLFALKFHFLFIVFTMAWGFIAQYITKFHCAMCKCLSCSSWINFQHINYKFSSPYSITIVAFNMLANPREYLLSFEALLYTLYFVMETFKSHITLWFLTFFQNIMRDSVFVKLSCWTIQWNVEIWLL